MSELIVKDSNGNQLKDGDSVTLIKSLKVKGGGTTLKARHPGEKDTPYG
jgi:protein PhnA